MDNKVVLVTGGSSGIGKAIGVYLTKKGYKVYGTTRNLNKLPDFKDFELLELDVTNEKTIKLAIAHILKNEGRIDVVVNNAGVGITGPIEETPINEINKAFDTNFNGPIRVIQSVLPQMREQKNGLIINITSIAGNMGLPYRGIYSATKGALGLVTEAIRMETKEFGVKITDLAPGDFATNIAAGRYHAPTGEESSYSSYKRVLDTINEDVNVAQNPNLVAKKIHSIIEKSNPKVHYSVGTFVQKLSLFLKRILPGKLYEKLLLNHYKL
ncbi:SDR family oxidoreductase [Croceitalea sp. MTPC9]|uniref:SDR family oxidoreductase n=1 Tax=unclassified Croceitalea TaxID=2632280 RepID=UPI002B397FBC|nr:SDR family oxidoreductase [Croceitalea sp. MTPC6]GMN15527.1 SDR family oxidoreductase [Croceitalea sp. MTPC9]